MKIFLQLCSAHRFITWYGSLCLAWAIGQRSVMLRKCDIPLCKSNNASSRKSEGTVPVFFFLKMRLWLKRGFTFTSTSNFNISKNIDVCRKHFKADDFKCRPYNEFWSSWNLLFYLSFYLIFLLQCNPRRLSLVFLQFGVLQIWNHSTIIKLFSTSNMHIVILICRLS